MVSRINNIKQALLILFIVIILLVFLFQSSWFRRLVYPLKYEDLIIEKANKYQLDPYLVTALIYVESKFLLDAKSHKGAIGLMQIMPDTARWISAQMPYNNFTEDLLFDPEVNIEFGSWYLADLIKEFGNERIIVLAAYNAGRGNVKRWLEENWDGQHTSIEILPFKETRDYIRQIIKVYEIYKKIYSLEIGGSS